MVVDNTVSVTSLRDAAPGSFCHFRRLVVGGSHNLFGLVLQPIRPEGVPGILAFDAPLPNGERGHIVVRDYGFDDILTVFPEAVLKPEFASADYYQHSHPSFGALILTLEGPRLLAREFGIDPYFVDLGNGAVAGYPTNRVSFTTWGVYPANAGPTTPPLFTYSQPA